jgi:EmrB/QacA subfamily drug resistance transporter
VAQPAASVASAARPAAPVDRRWRVLIVVAVAQLMVVLDSTIVNIALPSAQQALGFPNSDRQWVVTAYALAFGSLLLVGGRIGDMFSRKWVFITGLIGFAVSSAIGGAAVSFGMLVTARTLQGAFGAILAPAALGTLVSTFQDPRERGRAFGVFGSVAAGGGAVGLILGGVLTQYLSWRYTLYVNLVFAAIAVAGALVYLSGTRPAARPRMDWPGAVLSCAGLFLLVFGFSRAETAGWTAAVTIGSLVIGLLLLAAFAAAEQRSSHPLLPLRVILDRTRGGSYVAVGLAGIAIFGVFLFLTYYLQLVKGDSPLTCGLLFLPFVGCILLSSNVSSIVLLPRFGPRVLITVGMVLGVAAMVYLTRLTATSSFAADVLPAMLVMGLGFGMIFSPAINTATAGVRREDSGVASALVNTMQQVGGSIGTSALSTIALTATATYLAAHHVGPLAAAAAATHGYTVAFAWAAGLLGLGVILAIVLLPSRQRLQELRNAAAAASVAQPERPPEPQPQAQPQAHPQGQPQPEPQADRRPQPQAQPQALTQTQPQAQPQPQGQPQQQTQVIPEPHAIPVALCGCSPVLARVKVTVTVSTTVTVLDAGAGRP